MVDEGAAEALVKRTVARVRSESCIGCGRCENICGFSAVHVEAFPSGRFVAVVDELACKGCGNCISVCPSNAADSPYRDQAFLEQMLEEVLMQ